MYSDDGSMSLVAKALIAVAIIVILYFVYKAVSGESVIANPYAGTFYGMVPFPLFGGTVAVPAVNY